MHRFCILAAAAAPLIVGSTAHAVPLFGGPVYTAATSTGFRDPAFPLVNSSTAGNGIGVGSATRFSAGINRGTRAVRWDNSGNAATELGHLGTTSAGITFSSANAVNTAGTAVGWAYTISNNDFRDERAVRWSASGSVATELGNLGTSSTGLSYSRAYAINDAGTAVGHSSKYVASTDYDVRAVRWNASGTAATELGYIGALANGRIYTEALAINSAGTIVGPAGKVIDNFGRGTRAVRWDAGGTVATELGHIGTDSFERTESKAIAVNASGTAVGTANKYINNLQQGIRAVRWNASGTTATELNTLGTSSNGYTISQAYDVDDSGRAVGYALKYNSSGVQIGQRAVRWDAWGSGVTELGVPGTANNGTYALAWAVNAAGIAVGWSTMHIGSTDFGSRAVAWGLDGLAIDLNTLLSPAQAMQWTLTSASGISDTGWITGKGIFDADGPDSQFSAYERMFIMQIPGPGTATLLAMSASLLLARRRRT